MNTQQLASILKQDAKSKRFFEGVLSRDQFCNLQPLSTLPKRSSQAHFICNLDNSNQPGSHWVVIDFHRYTGKVFYFDPFGLPPLHNDVLQKISTDCSSFEWNDITFQNTTSTVCGQYCLIYCLFKSRGYSSKDILNLLYSDGEICSDSRDHLIHSFIQKLYPIRLKDFRTDVHDINSVISPI